MKRVFGALVIILSLFQQVQANERPVVKPNCLEALNAIETLARELIPKRLQIFSNVWLTIQRQSLSSGSFEFDQHQSMLLPEPQRFLEPMQAALEKKFERTSIKKVFSRSHAWQLAKKEYSKLSDQIFSGRFRNSLTYEEHFKLSRAYLDLMDPEEPGSDGTQRNPLPPMLLTAVLYTFEDLSISDFNFLRSIPMYPIGLISRATYADGKKMQIRQFAEHDLDNHARSLRARDLKELFPTARPPEGAGWFETIHWILPDRSDGEANQLLQQQGPQAAYQKILGRLYFEKNRQDYLKTLSAKEKEAFEYLYFYITREDSRAPEPYPLYVWLNSRGVAHEVFTRLNKKDFGKSKLKEAEIEIARRNASDWLKRTYPDVRD